MVPRPCSDVARLADVEVFIHSTVIQLTTNDSFDISPSRAVTSACGFILSMAF